MKYERTHSESALFPDMSAVDEEIRELTLENFPMETTGNAFKATANNYFIPQGRYAIAIREIDFNAFAAAIYDVDHEAAGAYGDAEAVYDLAFPEPFYSFTAAQSWASEFIEVVLQ